MKEYLKRLARGNFIYEACELSFETDNISGEAVRGRIGHFTISFNASAYVKGLIWSSNPRVKLESQVFGGEKIILNYTVDARVTESSEDIKEYIPGCFDIVCSAGEFSIPYRFDIVPVRAQTQLGEINELYDYASLVQSDYDEAQALFVKDNFSDIFIDDMALANIYDLLLEQKNTEVALEEFLVASRIKQPVNIEINENSREYCDISENYKDSVVIEKNSWGYTQIKVYSDSEFILPDTELVNANDFTGNRYELGYLIDKDKLHAGINCGVLTFETHNQRIDMQITVNADKRISIHKDKRTALVKLTELYLDYRGEKLHTGQWVEQSTQVLDRVRGIDNDNAYYKLIQAQLFLIQKREQEGKSILENVKKELTMMPDFSSDNVQYDREYTDCSVNQVHLYCFYLYVNSLALKDAAYTARAAGIIRNYYENGYDTWRLLWLLFYLDSSYTKNISIKLLRIKETCHKGCKSPVMYMEALQLMNEQPSLLRVFNNFELQVILFGTKYRLISEKLAQQVSAVIGTQKYASAQLVMVLKAVYEIYENDEILLSLISQMIRNEMYGEEYFSIYEKGVLRGIKITRLYEYYIKSIGKKKLRLPKLVLMYFAYDTLMNYKDKAYLLANVICNEKDNEEIMKYYQPQIEKFAYEQLKAKRFSDNLNIIYRYVWGETVIDEETAPEMIKFMFTYKVSCYNSNIKKLIVKHKELNTVSEYVFENNTAYIQLYTGEAVFVFEDDSENRYKNSISYEVERVSDDTALLGELMKYPVDNELLKMYAFENNLAVMQDEDATFRLVMDIKKNKDLSEYQKKSLNGWLICYYNEYYAGDNFMSELRNIDTSNLPVADAVRVIEMCITYDCYDEAYDMINRYGFEGVSTTSIFRFVRNRLMQTGIKEDGLIISACNYIFTDKKYNEAVLEYMVSYYNNTTEKMYELWKACRSFNTDYTELEERILAQMLFTNQHNGRMTEVFCSYYGHECRKYIVQAYISYHSNLYFVKGTKTNDIVFKVIEKYVYDDEEVLDVCRLALLKHYSAITDTLGINQIEIIKKLITRLCKEDKCFEFYKKFRGIMRLPYNMSGKTYIEYHANPEARVEIHYYYGDDTDNESTQIMNNCCGVFVNSFCMFYGDTINYYFTEDYDGKITKTKMFSYQYNSINMDASEDRFDCINDILASCEAHDTVTMKKLMNGYIVKDYVINELFKPMQ